MDRLRRPLNSNVRPHGKPQLFRKTEERTFFAHHMLLHAAELLIADAEATDLGRFNKCLSSMVLVALAVEALANAVGTRVVADWPRFERLRPHEKINQLVAQLGVSKVESTELWQTLQYLGRFRNAVAHPKPEEVVRERVMDSIGIEKTGFDTPQSALEREITLGNAKRTFAAVRELKSLLTDAMPPDSRFGISGDMWHSSTIQHLA